jgi:hypothetical protein
VRLVDHEQRDLAGQQVLEEFAVLEALGREVEDLALAALDFLDDLARLRVGQVRVHGQRVDAVGGKLVLLVLHQCDQGTDDDRQSLEHQCGKLVDERFPAARRHDDERVTAGEGSADRLPLSLLEVLVAEALGENALRLGFRRHRLPWRRKDAVARATGYRLRAAVVP